MPHIIRANHLLCCTGNNIWFHIWCICMFIFSDSCTKKPWQVWNQNFSNFQNSKIPLPLYFPTKLDNLTFSSVIFCLPGPWQIMLSIYSLQKLLCILFIVHVVTCIVSLANADICTGSSHPHHWYGLWKVVVPKPIIHRISLDIHPNQKWSICFYSLFFAY